jgi:uncharacterized protein (TIGR02145 family)
LKNGENVIFSIFFFIYRPYVIMKTIFWISAVISSVLLLIFSTECTKKESVVIPIILTTPITNIAATLAYSGGNITSDGGGTITVRGVCWSTNANPTVDLTTKTSDGTGSGIFTSSITGLTANTQYHIRSYATNSAGTAYGSDVVFTTTVAVVIPTITTISVSSITNTTATSGGNITSDGGATVTTRGVCWSTTTGPTTALSTKTTDNTGTGIFTSSITGLTAGTIYYVKAYATNSAGTSYGNEISFITSGPPAITTITITGITNTTATSGGNITSDGGASVTARGVCWNIANGSLPTINDNKTIDGIGIGVFSSSIIGLERYTTYNVRAYATNNNGTGYGNTMSFFTIQIDPIIFNSNLTYGTVSDIDGNVYKTIIIGTQTWMAENLKTTKYNDNSTIPLVTDASAWEALAAFTTPAYCWYNNDAATYKATYGALYNLFTVDVASNGGKNVCPTGWHIPSDDEWTTFTTYLVGETIAGGNLKETGTTHWLSPNVDATNETGFTALPGGYRGVSGTYNLIGDIGYWWSSTEYTTYIAWFRNVGYGSPGVGRSDFDGRYGFSVRCIKD